MPRFRFAEHDKCELPTRILRDRYSHPSRQHQSEDKQNQEDHQEDEEKDARDIGGRGGNAAETENRRDDGNEKEYQSPFQQ
jgi:hypothetical protein